jgi:prepilin-type N-terminal cleavage/methylation domain-containing protein
MSPKNSYAFTLIELLVVLSIIFIVGAFVATVIFEARKDSRDSIRASSAEQLALGVRLLKEAVGSYPAYPQGVQIGIGNPIDTQLIPFVPRLPVDPVGDPAFGFWYYSNFSCGSVTKHAILIKQMELQDNENFEAMCGSIAGSAGTYIVFIN